MSSPALHQVVHPQQQAAWIRVSSILTPLGSDHLYSYQWGQLYCAVQMRYQRGLPSDASGEGFGQHSLFPAFGTSFPTCSRWRGTGGISPLPMLPCDRHVPCPTFMPSGRVQPHPQPSTTGSALLCCQDERQSLLSEFFSWWETGPVLPLVLQPVRGGANPVQANPHCFQW